MEKSKYYLSVQACAIMSNQGDAAYEFEIEATPEQIEELQELLEDKREFDDATFWRAITPEVPYSLDQENDDYDAILKRIYAMIQALGTEETKHHISNMDLSQIGNWEKNQIPPAAST